MIIFAHSKCKRYENRKIQGVALPKKERNGQEWKSSHHGTHHGEQDYGAVLLQVVLHSIQKAFDVLEEKRTDFEAKDVKEALQGSVKTQTTLLSFVDEHISELSTHEGIDMSKSSVWTYRKIRKNLAEFIGEEYKLFLKRDQGRIDSYVNHCLLWLNMLMYKAVDRSIIRFNPIAKIGYEKKAAPKMTHISKADFIKMLSTPMADERTELARRCFIFASLTSYIHRC